MRGCSCEKCKEACTKNPGCPTVEEARALMKAGHGSRLMLHSFISYWLKPPAKIEVLTPAVLGFEGKRAPKSRFEEQGCCTFLKDGKCEVHYQKPIQCHDYFGCKDFRITYTEGVLQQMWAKTSAQKLVERWKKERGIE